MDVLKGAGRSNLILAVDALPYLGTGKLDLQAVRELARRQASGQQ